MGAARIGSEGERIQGIGIDLEEEELKKDEIVKETKQHWKMARGKRGRVIK